MQPFTIIFTRSSVHPECYDGEAVGLDAVEDYYSSTWRDALNIWQYHQCGLPSAAKDSMVTVISEGYDAARFRLDDGKIPISIYKYACNHTSGCDLMSDIYPNDWLQSDVYSPKEMMSLMHRLHESFKSYSGGRGSASDKQAVNWVLVAIDEGVPTVWFSPEELIMIGAWVVIIDHKPPFE